MAHEVDPELKMLVSDLANSIDLLEQYVQRGGVHDGMYVQVREQKIVVAERQRALNRYLTHVHPLPVATAAVDEAKPEHRDVDSMVVHVDQPGMPSIGFRPTTESDE